MIKIDMEIDERNKPITDEELDRMLPGQKDGYEVIYLTFILFITLRTRNRYYKPSLIE